MENAIAAGLSKQLVLMRALEVTANNVANQTTAGFKADHLSFREFVAEIDRRSSADPAISLVFDPSTYTDRAEGALQQTFRDFDFAIEGPGLFAVENDLGVFYTRDGRFGLNSDGALVTRSGAQVLDDGQAPIFIDPEQGPVVLSSDGELQQQGAPVARIGVFAFAPDAALEKTGDNLFSTLTDPDRGAGRARQGFLESSNVNPVRAMTDMIEIMRSYEDTARLIESANELSRRAVSTLSDAA